VQATNSFISDIKPKRLDKPKAVAEEIVKGGKKKAKNFETSIWFVSIFWNFEAQPDSFNRSHHVNCGEILPSIITKSPSY